MKISIICVYNNKEILEECLLKSLDDQNENYELILIDNLSGKFNCAADALNYGGNKSNGELLLFAHQDVKFFKNNLKEIKQYCANLENFGIAGIAGVGSDKKLKSNGVHDIPPIDISKNHITTPESVQTLDELLLIIPKNIFNKIKFDNETCNHWHLYGADYCLHVIKNNYKAYVLPITLYHVSSGQSMSLEYYDTLKNILNKYKNDFEQIYTICGGTHNPNSSVKLNILRYLEAIHLRNLLERFLEKNPKLINFLRKLIG